MLILVVARIVYRKEEIDTHIVAAFVKIRSLLYAEKINILMIWNAIANASLFTAVRSYSKIHLAACAGAKLKHALLIKFGVTHVVPALKRLVQL